jgi:agmatinase
MLHFLRRLFVAHEVLGCDVMELAPLGESVVSEFVAAKLVYKLIGYQAIAQNWPARSPEAGASIEG